MRKICVFTGTRAEYGLLSPLLKRIKNDDGLTLQLIVLGAHMSPEFGYTFHEIEADGFEIDDRIEMLLSSDTEVGICKSMGLTHISAAEVVKRLQPDLIVILGDRYEMLAIASVAVIMGVPIAHIHGGEITEGAFDDAIRHSITKMSRIHFAATEDYRSRIIQMGENPAWVHNVGSLGVENIRSLELLNRAELEKILDFSLDGTVALVTFHPVTMEIEDTKRQMHALLDSLEKREDIRIIFTKANADTLGRLMNQLIDDFVLKHPERAVAYPSLGVLKYLSAMKHASLVIGNSSSGIIEAPVFNLPVVNIGNRQKGRTQSECIINCEPTEEDILSAITLALSEEFLEIARQSESLYGNGDTSGAIVSHIKSAFRNGDLNGNKSFYDINYRLEDVSNESTVRRL